MKSGTLKSRFFISINRTNWSSYKCRSEMVEGRSVKLLPLF
jgi:hypothetical protein